VLQVPQPPDEEARLEAPIVARLSIATITTTTTAAAAPPLEPAVVLELHERSPDEVARDAILEHVLLRREELPEELGICLGREPPCLESSRDGSRLQITTTEIETRREREREERVSVETELA